jgi:DNA-binding MarR family transcriptional regulator
MDHDENVIAAATLAVSDHVRSAVEQAAGRGGGGAAALTALHAWGEPRAIDELALGLRLSHSRAVRVVDALVADGLARRAPDPDDRRRVLVLLTAAGRRTCRRMLRARELALRDAIAGLTAEQRTALAEIAEVLVAGRISRRDDAFFVCRFCEPDACGHIDGRCPVTRRALALDGTHGG